MGPQFIFATVEGRNFKFSTQLGFREQLTTKQLLTPKLSEVRTRGASKKFGTPYLFLQPLKPELQTWYTSFRAKNNGGLG